jgi:hypothetical protein
MATCKWCKDDYKVDETRLCKNCREKKVRIEKRLEQEWEARHGRRSGAFGFDNMYGTTHILDFGWAWKVGGQLLNEANYKAALKLLPKRFISEATIGHWATPYHAISIHIWNDKQKKPTKAWDVYEELQESLEQYPVLDEELWSQIEWNDLIETIENCFDWEIARKIEAIAAEQDRFDIIGRSLFPEDWVDQVLRHPIAESRGWNSGEDIESKYMDEIIEELALKWIEPALDPEGYAHRLAMTESQKQMRRLL